MDLEGTRKQRPAEVSPGTRSGEHSKKPKASEVSPGENSLQATVTRQRTLNREEASEFGYCEGCHQSRPTGYLCPCDGERIICMGQTEKHEFGIVQTRMDHQYADGRIFSYIEEKPHISSKEGLTRSSHSTHREVWLSRHNIRAMME